MSQEKDNQHQSIGERYLVFALGAEQYAIPLLGVKEVIAMPEVTPIPYSPPHFLGLMNLRGQVISVVDFRLKLGIKPQPSAETAVIICDLDSVVLGVVVDAIQCVISPNASELSEKPDVPGVKNSDYILQVYRKDPDLILMLDIAKALGVEELALAKQKSKQAA